MGLLSLAQQETENIDHMREQLHLVECDLRDLSSVQHLVEQAAPDYIVHLAAQSFVASSWHAPAETLYTNSVSQVNLLEAIRQGKENAARFLAIGSSEEYGLVGKRSPVIQVGNLKARRDYTDVRDIVRGYWRLLESGEALGDLLDYWRARVSAR